LPRVEVCPTGEGGGEGDASGQDEKEQARGAIDAALVEMEAGSEAENDERGGEQFDKAVKAER